MSNSIVRIVAVSGSLRAHSSNRELLLAVAALAPPEIEISIFEGLGDLPHFNPDLEEATVAPSLHDWRARLLAADGVIFSTPEYAHGLPGVLKNGLDWVVGTGELVAKPVALFNASARATFAQASLTETLTVMSARVIAEASVTVPLLGKPVLARQIVEDPAMAVALRSGIDLLSRAIRAGRAERAGSGAPPQ